MKNNYLIPLFFIGLLASFSIWFSPSFFLHSFNPYSGIKTHFELPPLQLKLLNEKNINLHSLGKKAFLFFGYARCKNACPLNLRLFSQMQKMFFFKDYLFVFISLDQDEKSFQILKNSFAKSFPKTIFLKSKDAKTKELSKKLKSSYEESPYSKEIKNHQSFIYLIHDNKVIMTYPQKKISEKLIIQDITFLKKQKGNKKS